MSVAAARVLFRSAGFEEKTIDSIWDRRLAIARL